VSDEAPFADLEAEEGESAAAQTRAGLRLRLADLFGRGDPVLGALVVATLISTLGRGLTMTLTVLYLAIIAGLTPAEIALASTCAAVVGIFSAYAGGWLSDRVSARRLMLVLTIVDALAIGAYVFVDDVVLAIIVGCVSFGFGGGARSAQAASSRAPSTVPCASGRGPCCAPSPTSGSPWAPRRRPACSSSTPRRPTVRRS
jgi:MFS family permease